MAERQQFIKFTIAVLGGALGTDKKTIKSYNDNAPEWAARIRSSKNLAHEYLEKPAMYSKLPTLRGKTVLCLGCGTGEECNALLARGAKRVVGVDLSSGLITIARESFPDVDFHVMDMEKLKFPRGYFDLVYSSLTIHYVRDWGETLKEVRRVLRPGGTFLFSTHHPVKWGALVERTKAGKRFTLGYSVAKQDNTCETYGDYLNTRKIEDVWFGNFPVVFYHKPLSEIIQEVLKADFEIADFLEPKAVAAAKKHDKAFWAAHQKIPTFMIFELRKP